jgi:hypothetical protein
MVLACRPISPSLHGEALLLGDDGLTILTAAEDETARCLHYGWRTHRVHSWYIRTIADLP